MQPLTLSEKIQFSPSVDFSFSHHIELYVVSLTGNIHVFLLTSTRIVSLDYLNIYWFVLPETINHFLSHIQFT